MPKLIVYDIYHDEVYECSRWRIDYKHIHIIGEKIYASHRGALSGLAAAFKKYIPEIPFHKRLVKTKTVSNIDILI